MAVGFSVSQVAELLSCDESTVIRRIQAGHLPAAVVSGKRGGRSGTVYQVTADALRLHVQQQVSSRTGQAPAEPIDLGTFLARGGMDAVRAAADRRSIIQAALNVTGPNKVEALRLIAADAGVHLSTLYGWMKAARAEGGATLEGAARTMPRSKFDENGMHRRSAIEPEARAWFQAKWLELNKKPVTVVIELYYKAKAAEMGWSVPSRATFYRLVSEDLPAIERTLGRDGNDRVRSDLLPKNSIAPPKQRNQVWMTDSRQMDFWVQHPETGEPIRPWVTPFIDAAARTLPYVATATAPAAENTRKAFTGCVYAPEPYTMGIPQMLIMDNGSEFRNQQMISMFTNLGIKVYLCEQGAGWAKGMIESAFKTMSLYLDKTSRSWTGNKPTTRPEGLDEKQLNAEGRLPTWAEWENIILPAYLHWYNHEHKHSGHGMNGKTPLERYAELPNGSKGVPSAAALSVLFTKSEERQVTDAGIKLWGKLLWHEDLYAYGNRVRRPLVNETVEVRFDPADKTCAFVFYHGEYVCTVTDKPMPTWAPDDEENMAIAGKVHALGRKLYNDAHANLTERAASVGLEPWMANRHKLMKPNSKQGETKPEKAPRMITPADRAAEAIASDKEKASEAKRKSDPNVAAKVRKIGGGGLLG